MVSKNDHLVYHISRNWRVADLTEPDVAMLEYVEKLTRTPGQVNGEDAQRLRDVGFDDRQVLDIIMISAIFAFMTRLADGTGTHAEDGWRATKTRKDEAVEAELKGA